MPITSAPTRVAAQLSGDINFTEHAPPQDLKVRQALYMALPPDLIQQRAGPQSCRGHGDRDEGQPTKQ